MKISVLLVFIYYLTQCIWRVYYILTFDPYKHTTHRFTFCYINIFISFLSFPQLWDKSTTKICRWAVLLWVESIKKIDWFWNENNIVVGDRWSGSHMACVLVRCQTLIHFVVFMNISYSQFTNKKTTLICVLLVDTDMFVIKTLYRYFHHGSVGNPIG